MIFAFGDFELDEERRELRRAGSVVSLEPKSYGVLRYLLHHRQRMVSKQELREAMWPDVAVAESSLAWAVHSVRAALGDTGAEQRFVRTLWRRGFRFVAPVEERDSGAPRSSAETAEGSSPFQRAAVEAKLERALADASAGRGRIVLFTARPGIGSSQTAAPHFEWAAKCGAPVLKGGGPAVGPAVPYGPWLPILRGLVHLVDDAGLRGRLRAESGELAGVVPELRTRISDLSEPAGGSPDDSRFRLFDAVASLLRAAASDMPLVMILDGFPAADPSSLRLLEFLAREIAASRILLLIAAGDVPAEASRSIEETLAEFARSSGFERIPL